MNKLSVVIAKIILLTVVLLSPVLAFADSRASVLFLLIEPGSRPGGMGHAYVSLADDGFAQFWNPGALAFNRKNQFAFMHSNWFGDLGADLGDMYYEYFGWNKYFEEYRGNLGVNAVFLTYGTQDKTDHNGNLIGTFTSYEIALGTTYSYQHTDNLGLGVGFKFIWSDLSPDGQGDSEVEIKGRGLSYAFDLGILWKDIFYTKGLNWGLNIQNIGPNITYIDHEQPDPLPLNFRMGLSYQLFGDEYNRFTISGDMNKLLANNDFVLARLVTAWYDDGGLFSKREIEQTIFGVGAEYVYWNLLSLRAGYLYDKAGKRVGPCFGAGIQYTFSNRYHAFFNYAMEEAGELVDYNHTFSLGIEF